MYNNFNRKFAKDFWLLFAAVILIIVLSFICGSFTPYDPHALKTGGLLEPPGIKHIFGTDDHGRDVLSRVLAGSRISILSSIILVLLSCTFGTALGVICGYFGGLIDMILMRINDIFLAFPGMILAVAIAGLLGGGLFNALIAIFVTSWTQYARLARSQTMVQKEEAFVHAAKLSGCSDINIMFVHILPNIISTLIVTAAMNVSVAMMGIAGLSFLGFGVKIPHAEWGSMISEGKKYLQTAPWMALAPAGVMVFVMIIFNLFGEKLRDILAA